MDENAGELGGDVAPFYLQLASGDFNRVMLSA
jgi:hypothetical protein